MLEERLNSLLLDWQEELQQGSDVPAAELCRACPELARHRSPGSSRDYNQIPAMPAMESEQDVPADQSIEVTEFDRDYRGLDWKPVPEPK